MSTPLGEFVRARRLELGLTLAQLAGRTNDLNPASVSNLETGRVAQVESHSQAGAPAEAHARATGVGNTARGEARMSTPMGMSVAPNTGTGPLQRRALEMVRANPGIHGDVLIETLWPNGVIAPCARLAALMRGLMASGHVEARPLWQGGGWWAV